MLITKTVAKICLMIDMLYSIDLLLIGGNRSGEGFIGGVLCACGIGLIYVAVHCAFLSGTCTF
ncbi:MnhB domain-containing protein [Methanosarcina sp. DH2]|uniref:MnhB domain-containing protein n=1 Tax=Methanosarcina sp. DH2 TaxID=2605639 RepID=UPI001E35D36B